MIRKIDNNEIRSRIHKRIRRKLSGTPERPRLAVFRSVAHIYAQVIDDSKGQTVVSASSVEKAAKTNGGNVAAAKAIGKLEIGQKLRIETPGGGGYGNPDSAQKP